MTESLEQEIRTLRSIFWSARDPEGRAFVPLADAYRRAGDFRQAMELLTEGLDRHPEFASAHAVAAQLYLDHGLLQEAELASRRVLDLDGDNVIGLRCLASSLKAQGRDAEADELSAQLEELQGEEEAGAVEPDAQASVPEESAPEDEGPEEAPAPGEEPEPEVAELAPEGDDSEAAETSHEDVLDISTLAPDQAVQAGVYDVIPDEPVMDLDALAPDEGVVDLDALAPDDMVMDMDALAPDDMVVDMDALAPDEAHEPEDEGAAAALAGASAVLPDEPVIDLEDLAPAEGDAEPYEDGLPDDEEGTPLVTRTLAELYARQGQVERAVEVYRQILEATPGDEDLIRRIAELEAGVDDTDTAVDAEPLEADAPEPEPVEAEVVEAEAVESEDAAALEATLEAEAAAPMGDDEEVMEHPWDAEAQQALHEVDTPFAWTEEEGEEVPEGPPISAYFARLLAWEPKGAEEEGDAAPTEDEAPDASGEDDDDTHQDGFTSWLNQDDS